MPSFFDSVKSAVSDSSSTFGAIADGLNTVSKLSSIANNLSDPGKVLSAIRSFNLPNGGESSSNSRTGSATWQGANDNDWRAKLSILDKSFFDNAPILGPIKSAGGLIFPYTPTIGIGSSVSYNDQTMTHSNYQFVSYQASRVNEINVVGDFPVEDSDQAAYWLAVLHFLRSVTKMYTGNTGDTNPGNPPPVLNFSAYGDYVFKNIPVVVTSFSIQLGKDVDYIAVNPLVKSNSSGTDNISKTSNLLAGVASAIGQTKAANLIKTGASIANALSGSGRGAAAGAAGAAGSRGDSHVPTNSSITVNLRPVYSREKIRNFSLNKFIKGDYVGQGYL
jgi:hypothetical protein